MDSQLAEKYISEALEEKYRVKFEISGGARNFVFKSQDYDFSFSAGMTYESSEQTLKSKINRWLERDASVIKPNSHVIYDADGVMQSSSVLGGK